MSIDKPLPNWIRIHVYAHTLYIQKKKTLQTLFKGIAAISVKNVALFPGSSLPPAFHWTTKKLAGTRLQKIFCFIGHYIGN